jgi:hypothetical protein
VRKKGPSLAQEKGLENGKGLNPLNLLAAMQTPFMTLHELGFVLLMVMLVLRLLVLVMVVVIRTRSTRGVVIGVGRHRKKRSNEWEKSEELFDEHGFERVLSLEKGQDRL